VADIVWQGGLGKVSPAGTGVRDKLDEHMTELSEIYNQRILELSANIPLAERLPDADATATAHSKLCGSTVTVDIKLAGDRVMAYGQTVKACLLGQASASVMAHNIVGSSAQELREVGATMRHMLKAKGAPPGGRWADLAVLEPVKDYKARHASTLLVFDAVESALAAAEAKRAAPEDPPTRGLACAATPAGA
jgi:NifU-like protein involved in Fe-S cluster formation